MSIVKENCLFYWEGETQETSRTRGGEDDVDEHIHCLIECWFSKGPRKDAICRGVWCDPLCLLAVPPRASWWGSVNAVPCCSLANSCHIVAYWVPRNSDQGKTSPVGLDDLLSFKKKSALNSQCKGKKATAMFLILLHFKNEKSNRGAFLFASSIIICLMGGSKGLGRFFEHFVFQLS